MNKVLNINLGGYPFTIDEDAYEHLKVYLETIHRHFEDSEGYDEITTDIEARVAELFQENLGDRPIVALQNVKDAILIMGTPEDFGAEGIEEDGDVKTQKKAKYKTGKRLFRNPEVELIGGVCSGVTAYFRHQRSDLGPPGLHRGDDLRRIWYPSLHHSLGSASQSRNGQRQAGHAGRSDQYFQYW